MSAGYLLPPRLETSRGTKRRVGIEIEFGNLDVAATAALVARLYGGRIEAKRFSAKVVDTTIGDFEVVLDATFLESERYLQLLEKLGLEPPGQRTIENMMEAVAMTFIPSEISAPPIPIDRLALLDPLRAELHAAGATGTRAALRYAFGLHFNPEAPDLEARTLQNYLAAFMLLYDWIVEVSDIDVSRRIAPFIDPFPDEYRELVIDPAYRPEITQLIDDYLALNPTRNRPLDMLPMFAMIDEPRVRAGVGDEHKVNSRPTFHYRLPNSLVDEPEWSFAVEWNRWIEVERLAGDEARLEAMARAYGKYGTKRRWSEAVWSWLEPDGARDGL